MSEIKSSHTELLKAFGIPYVQARYQLSPDTLTSTTLSLENGKETESGALAINTGVFTGRSPKDRYIVKDNLTEKEVYWGEVNQGFDSGAFDLLYEKMKRALADKTLFVRDGFACADPRYQLSIRVCTEYAWSSLFVNNMFIRPSTQSLKEFKPDWLVLNLPTFKANPKLDGTRQENFTIINFTKKIVLIGGSGYTGEIKKSIFSILNFLLPLQKNTLPMHCSANSDSNGKTTLFFGLSGTGKTTLSADKNRKLIGDDEHGWTSDNKVFNFEGGCYAKVYNLSKENEPEIFEAIKKGALLENVTIDKEGKVDYKDTSITQNTRVSYPIDFIPNVKNPSIGDSVKHVFFLTADAFGVLPPISKLTPSQAAYHFISGYTAKIPGTEEGISEPFPIFSACFGAPFMPLHPVRYAEMLAQKIKKNEVNVWMINTGWTGGPYGVGKRISLAYTRAMIRAVFDGHLGEYSYKDYHIHSVFGVAQPRSCPGVPSQVLSPRQTWNNDKGYYQQAYKLAKAFRENFKQFEVLATPEIRKAAPQFGKANII